MPVVTVRTSRRVAPVIRAQAIVTTTIWPNGTAPPITQSTGTSQSNGDNIPKGAIIGGILTGVALAIIAVIGWRLWGRSIEKTEKKKRIEAEKAQMTKANTRRNAGDRANARANSYRPIFTEKSERKVQFVQQVSAKMTDVKNKTFASMLPTPPPPAAQVEFGEKPPSKPKPVHALKTSLDMESEGLLDGDSASPTKRPSPKTRVVQPKTTNSSLSSASMYSTQSQENNERPPSWATAAWTRYSFMSTGKNSKGSMREAAASGAGTRLSQISQETFSTASSQQRDSNGVPIGVAY